MDGWKVERLAGHHDRSGFNCGHPSLDVWIERYASQHEKRDLARTYVLVRPGESRVAGYYALSTCQLSRAILPAERAGKLPKESVIPAILLGRLAIDSSHHGQGLGGGLLVDALRRVQSLADRVGVMAVVVDAIDDRATAFYLHHQFLPLLDDPRHLFLPVATIRKLGLEPISDGIESRSIPSNRLRLQDQDPLDSRATLTHPVASPLGDKIVAALSFEPPFRRRPREVGPTAIRTRRLTTPRPSSGVSLHSPRTPGMPLASPLATSPDPPHRGCRRGRYPSFSG